MRKNPKLECIRQRQIMSDEIYTPGHSATAAEFMARRSIETHGAFLIPLLRPGQDILDCGCGPGGITIGIARRVAPGRVVGIDKSAAQLERARDRASDEDVVATFQQGNIYALPFADDSFDGVFSHALFEHLAEPIQALDEIRRVLKPGGFVALRSPDWGGFVLHPWNESIRAAIEAHQKMQTANGGDVLAGRKLAVWLTSTGFRDVTRSASYEIYPSAEMIANYLAFQLEAIGQTVHAQELRSWSKEPAAMFAQAWFEALARA